MFDTINNFAQNLDNLRSFIALVDAFLTSHQQSVGKEKAIYLAPVVMAMVKLTPEVFKEHGISEELLKRKLPITVEMSEVRETDGKKSISFDLPEDDERDVIQALKETLAALRSKEILYQGALMTLTSSVEWFISQLIQVYYEKFPNALGGKDKFFSLEDLKNFNDLKDAQRFLIDSKVEDLMRKAFSDWIKFIKDNLALSMGYLKESEKFLTETYQRRHLIVHNGGIVNSISLSKVDKELTKDLQPGKQIKTDVDYLNNRINLFELNCLLIGLEAWKKQDESNRERAQIILSIISDHISDGRWSIVEGLSYFLMGDKKMGERERVEAQLYFWLSLKNQGKWEEIKAEVASADFSARDKKLQIKHLAILGNTDAAYALLEDAIKAKDISIGELSSNPIFSSICGDARYKPLADKYSSLSKSSKIAKKSNKPRAQKSVPSKSQSRKKNR